MTIDETKDELYRLLSDCVNNSYPIRNNTQKGRYRNAVKMAIASLEAWEKVRAEIEDEKIDFDINIGMEKYYNNAIDDVLQIIDRHLQEVAE